MNIKNIVQIFATAAIIMELSTKAVNAQQFCDDDCWKACVNFPENSFEYCMSLCCDL